MSGSEDSKKEQIISNIPTKSKSKDTDLEQKEVFYKTLDDSKGTAKESLIVLGVVICHFTGNSNEYNISANADGTYTVIDTIVGRDGKKIVAADSDLHFSDKNFNISDYENSDLIVGGGGDEIIAGGTGGDTITGTVAGDTIFGGYNDDYIASYAGDDSLFGGAGGDSLEGGAGADILFGNVGQDTLISGIGDDTIFGEVDDDLIIGGDGNDTLFGSSGNDSFWGGSGNDVIDGGEGTDIANFSGNQSDYIITDNGDNTYTVNGPDGADIVEHVEILNFSDNSVDIDRAVNVYQLSGTFNEYSITANGDGSYTLEDTISARDGSKIVNNNSDLIFSDSNYNIVNGELVAISSDDTPEAENIIEDEDALEDTSGNDILIGNNNGPELLSNGNYAISNSSGLTISIDSIASDASYNNSLGFYFADKNGSPISGIVSFANVKDTLGEGDAATISYSSDDIPAGALVFFAIPDGADQNPNLKDGDFVTFTLNGEGEWIPVLEGLELEGAQGIAAFYSDKDLNSDNCDHMDHVDFGQMQISFEDLVGGGDEDNNDVIANITIERAEFRNDTLIGGAGNDTAIGGVGDDIITGGDGDDIVVFQNAFENYTITENKGGTFTVEDTVGDGDGINIISDVEMLQFGDGYITLDGKGFGGKGGKSFKLETGKHQSHKASSDTDIEAESSDWTIAIEGDNNFSAVEPSNWMKILILQITTTMNTSLILTHY